MIWLDVSRYFNRTSRSTCPDSTHSLKPCTVTTSAGGGGSSPDMPMPLEEEEGERASSR